MKILYSTISILLCFSLSSQAQTWSDWDESTSPRRELETRDIIPDRYQTYELEFEEMMSILAEQDKNSIPSAFNLNLPSVKGGTEIFECRQYEIMEEGLARKFPHIKAYKAKSMSSGATAYLSVDDFGFHAAIMKGGQTWYIDPYARESREFYILYNISDFNSHAMTDFSCGSHTLEDNVVREKMEEWLDLSNESPNRRNLGGSGSGPVKELYRYRLAMATTGEFTSFTGGTKATAMSAIVNIVNRVNSIYEVDNAISLLLVENNDRLIYLNGATDPYTNGNTDAMIDENQANVTSVIGTTNFDIGHILGTANSVNGLARLYAVCNNAFKAMGASSHDNPSGDPFVINVVSHEMGHQFSAFHTMYHCHNVTQFNAIEPGSGSTVMSYAGICNPANRNIQDGADPYFHGNSLNQIFQYSRFDEGRNCPEKIDIGNTTPMVDLAHNAFHNIPIRTPFKLTGTATDAEDENLTYCWEQTDAGPYDPDVQPTLGSPQENAALFRSYPPSDNPTRYFPALEYLVNNNEFYIFEILPNYQRNLSFSLTVRDNHPGGGAYGRATMAMTSHVSAGPFFLTSPTKDTIVHAGSPVEIKWNVANTDIAPVNCQKIDILLSVDGGYTYPYTLLYNTDNDGQETVIIPDVVSSEARIMVAAADNVFFDISDENFQITAAEQPAYYVNFENVSLCVCLPDYIEIEIPTSSMAGYQDPVTFTLSAPDIPNASIELASDVVTAGETAVIVLDLLNVNAEGQYTVGFHAESTNGIAFDRKIDLSTISNQFDAFTLNQPEDGLSNTSLTPIFVWNRVDDADNYTFELSTSADFAPGNTVAKVPNLLAGSYSLPTALDQNTIYYWRVIANNACGAHLRDVFSFQTETVVCTTYVSQGPAQVFSTTEPKTLTSDIVITEDLAVDDINVRGIRGSHNNFSDLTMTLTAPNSSSVVLLDQKCGTPVSFDFGFDDESSLLISACDFIDQKLLQPENPLSGLDGISTNGTWTISLQDNVAAQGGTFFSWSIEMCATLNPSDPYLVRNDTLKVKPSKGRVVTDLFLEAADDDNGPAEITFTLVTIPQFGLLMYNTTALVEGSTFTQNDIISELIVYKHNGGQETEDAFRFTLTDPDGGFYGTPTFRISMDTSVTTTSVINEVREIELSVYPNPAHQFVRIQTLDPGLSIHRISLYDRQGKMILHQDENWVQAGSISTSNITSGMYILHVVTEKGVAVRKIMIDHL